MRERAAAPEGYPSVPAEAEVLSSAEVLAAERSIDSEQQLAELARRRFSVRSASLAPPTLSYARRSGEVESSTEVGFHLPVGKWINRSRSLAADSDEWGLSEQEALQLQIIRSRFVAYAHAVLMRR